MTKTLHLKLTVFCFLPLGQRVALWRARPRISFPLGHLSYECDPPGETMERFSLSKVRFKLWELFYLQVYLLHADIREGQFAAISRHHHYLFPEQYHQLFWLSLSVSGSLWVSLALSLVLSLALYLALSLAISGSHRRWYFGATPSCLTIAKTTTCMLGAERGVWICSSLPHSEQSCQTLSACTTWSTPCPRISFSWPIQFSVNTLRKVKRLAKYQRSQRRGDLGPPSTSAHWSACTKRLAQVQTKVQVSHCWEETWRQSQQPHSRRIWGSGFGKEICTWRMSTVKMD